MNGVKFVLRRAAELVEGALAASTRTSEAAIVREAARVLRSRAILFGSGTWFPPGVVVHLSPPDHQRLSPMFSTARSVVAAKIAARLRTPDGRVPEVRVVFDLDPELGSGFAVSAFERSDAPGRLTLVKAVQPSRADASAYPYLVWPDGRRVRIDPSGMELGREVAGAGRVTDATVSARHAVVVLDAGFVRVSDVGSTNGTWVNGVKSSDSILRHGDMLRLGSTAIRLDWPGSEPTAVLVDAPWQGAGDMRSLWAQLVAHVPRNEDRLKWLAQMTGLRFRTLDRVRRLQAADGLSPAEVEWAVPLLRGALKSVELRHREETA